MYRSIINETSTIGGRPPGYAHTTLTCFLKFQLKVHFYVG